MIHKNFFQLWRRLFEKILRLECQDSLWLVLRHLPRFKHQIVSKKFVIASGKIATKHLQRINETIHIFSMYHYIFFLPLPSNFFNLFPQRRFGRRLLCFNLHNSFLGRSWIELYFFFCGNFSRFWTISHNYHLTMNTKFFMWISSATLELWTARLVNW